MAQKEDVKKVMLATRQDPSLIKRVKLWAVEHAASLQETVALALEDLLKKKR